MAPAMVLLLTLLAMPVVARESKADPLEQLMGHAHNLGFAVEEVWTERDGRVRLVLRPGKAPAPTPSEDPFPISAEAEAAATADAYAFLAHVLETFSDYAIQDKVKVDSPRVSRTGAEITTTIRVSFREKEGYLCRDLMRLFTALEKSHPGARLCSIDLGKRDATLDQEWWRPISAALATATQPRGPSVLQHLATLRAALDGEDFEARLTRVQVDDRGIKWDMGIRDISASTKLFATLREAFPGDHSPGAASTGKAGIWSISGSIIRFKRP